MNRTPQTERATVDFDAWSRLAALNPAAFEKKRQAAIDKFINSAPKRRQPRLRCLQWRIDQERRAAATPIGACIRISRMMWDRITGEHGLIQTLADPGAALGRKSSTRLKQGSARVISLRPGRD